MNMSNSEIASVFGVTERTIWTWRKKHKSFADAAKAAWNGRRRASFRG
jgi:hypothetical protein